MNTTIHEGAIIQENGKKYMIKHGKKMLIIAENALINITGTLQADGGDTK